jgi:hypothetical protein
MRLAAQKDKEPRDWQNVIKYIAKPDFTVEDWMSSIGYGFEGYP